MADFMLEFERLGQFGGNLSNTHDIFMKRFWLISAMCDMTRMPEYAQVFH